MIDHWIDVGSRYEWEDPPEDENGIAWGTLKVDEIWVDEDGETQLNVSEYPERLGGRRSTSLHLSDLFEKVESGELTRLEEAS